ncbi:LysR family transcriptional regulator [Gordonia sp. PP30]|uniref:LysR family transcriptional regulator n=1 Tax=unclassified Gordonia (in: high G+C Gram-positive bacteria) TaxID=2657482 RepID=UPI001FFFE783|nr:MULTISPECIES: LysR family transcriptional regulator [unclassified Gordonia (in: high G+C Gram-positive bacteria)]UQE74446.1 LysR family transcriptional regulator [Gordonia sp. PP30]
MADLPPRSVDPRTVRADDLRYLLAVSGSRNRSAAAAALGVDASTVSRRIRALEQALGVPLIRQGPTGWELTDAGRAVAETARSIESAVDGAIRAVTGTAGDALRGNVRITAPDAFGTYFVAPALVRLRAAHPGLTVELLTATRELSVHQSGYDLAIAVGTPLGGRLVSEPISEYALGFYASADYLADHGVPATVDDVRDHPIIWYVDSLLQVGQLDLDKHLPGVTPRFMSTNVFAQVEATLAGGGVGLLPAFVADRHPGLRRVLRREVDVRLGYSLAAHRDRVTDPVVRALRDAVIGEVRARRSELLPA